MSPDQIVILAAYLIFWQAYKLRRKFSGLGHAALILSLTATLANSTTARLSDANPPSLITGQYYDFVEHIFVLISVAGLYVFHLAVEHCTLRSRRVLLTLGGAFVVAAVLAVGVYHAITYGPLLAISVESYHDPFGFVYAFGSGMYYGIVMGLVATWMWRYVRAKDTPFRRGIRIAALGIYAISVLSILRAVPIGIVFVGGPDIEPPFLLLGAVTALSFPLVFIGLSYPLVVSRWHAYRAGRRRRQISTDVRVVWQQCQVVYPEIVLRPRSRLERAGRVVWNPDKLHRLTTESFDALAKLLVQSLPVDTTPGRIAAESLRTAVRRYDDTHAVSVRAIIAPPGAGPHNGAPAQPDHDASIDMLVSLANVLREGTTDERERARA